MGTYGAYHADRPHEHNWFLGTVKKEFTESEETGLYVATEYAYLLCKCGVIKRVIVEEGEHEKLPS